MSALILGTFAEIDEYDIVTKLLTTISSCSRPENRGVENTTFNNQVLTAK